MKILEKIRSMASSRFIEKEISSQESSLYANWTIGSYNPDELVGKKGLKIYKDMRTDEQVKACLMMKKFARLSTGWEIKPGDDEDKLSIELADFAQYNVKRIKGTFYDTLLGILTALDYGFSISEIVREYIEEGDFRGKVGLKAIKSREPFGYGFKTDVHGNLLGITFEQAGLFGGKDLGSNDNPYPPEKFVVYSYQKEFSNWFGRSDFREIYRSWWSKNMIIKFYNIFLERFGMPTVTATYPSGQDEKVLEMIDDILKNLQAKSGFRFPEGIKFELLEATRRGEAGYEKAIELHNTMIARGILVPELMGFTGRSSGSRALGETQFGGFIWVLEKLGKDIEETIVDEQILRPLININYANVHEKQYPVFKMNSLSDEDIEMKAKVVKIGVEAGVIDPTEQWVRDYLMFPKREEKDIIPKPKLKKPVVPDEEPGEEPTEKEPVEKESYLIEKFQLRRKPDKFEQKVNFNQFADNVQGAEDLLRQDLITIFKSMRDKLLKSVERHNVVAEKDYRFIAKLQIPEVGKLKTTIQNHMVKTHLDNKIAVLEELQRAGEPIEIIKKFRAFEDWDPVPPSQAIELFRKKVLAKIAKEGAEKVLLTMANFKELKYYDSRAFAIAGIERDYILKEAKLALQNGIKQGLGNREIMGNLNDIFDKYIPTGEIVDGKLVSPARLETIVRTNISDAINLGRDAMWNDPNVSEFVPYLAWSSIIDDRTTPYCESMDGRTFKRTDPLLHSPPAHFSCRSILVPITQIEVDQEVKAGRGIEVDEITDIPRAKGFDESSELNIIRGEGE